MVLDINLFRKEKGFDPDVVRESQRRRYADVTAVDKVIELDAAWRACQFQVDKLKGEYNKVNKEVAKKRMAKEDASELMAKAKSIDEQVKAKEVEVTEAKKAVDLALNPIGSIVHDSVPVHDDEDNNAVVRTWGEPRDEDKLYGHVDLVHMLEIADLERGVNTAGGRGYYLKGMGVLLNQALINFGLSLLVKKGYTPLQPPFFMRKEVMAECAQLEQFDEELYKVTGEGEDKYLIATSEQPLCTFHRGEWMDPKNLPLRYCGYSTCFRKEAGSHGRDTLGIFRVHQFEKVEQFCITSPLENQSWEMLEEMIGNSEEFYQGLGIPYRVVAIVSGALNNAAAKKYDLEGWFPGSKAFRELVSCSNCTDYQSRSLEIRYGMKKMNEAQKQYVHLLNSTLTATERTICCILETHQTEKGVTIPECLRPFMMGIDFIPFKAAPPAPPAGKEPKAKKAKGDAAAPSLKEPKKTAGKGEAKTATGASSVTDSAEAPDSVAKSLAALKISGKGKPTKAAEKAPDSTTASLPVDTKVFLGGSSDETKALRFFCAEAGITEVIVDTDDGGAVPAANGRRLSTLGKLPLFQAGDVLLSQSHAIMRHLANLTKSHLYPSDNAAAMAKVESILEWRLTSLLPAVSSAEKSGPDPTPEIGKVLSLAEGWLGVSPGKYLTGRGLTIADIVVASTLARLEAGGVALPSECPAVATWLTNVKSRSHWQQAA